MRNLFASSFQGEFGLSVWDTDIEGGHYRRYVSEPHDPKQLDKGHINCATVSRQGTRAEDEGVK